MQMGRNKLPDSIKQLRGTDQPCRMAKVDLGNISKLPPPNKAWSKTIKDIYKTLGKSLLATKILTATNLPQFVSYCVEVGVYLEGAEKYNSVESRVEVNDKGRSMVSGYAYAQNMALQNAIKLGREFGFTPATVTKIAPVKKEDQNPFDKFLNS
jgi:phage terminase small subunit